MNVLVVEDRPTVREVLIAVASSALTDAKVQGVAGLEEGLAAACATRMDAVLLDLGLPGCRGIEALERFKAAFPRLTVVVVSSNDDSQLIRNALQAGASGYIPKALSPAAMAAALRGTRISGL
jgi:DNA-binding NarL/FixJ family response regulator